ncbi:hypothetical protein J6590_034309 [Homalodisca vitripennis]|nr:hypothetical protein J6590_034309 [Homalodisca vitripennis]
MHVKARVSVGIRLRLGEGTVGARNGGGVDETYRGPLELLLGKGKGRGNGDICSPSDLIC